MRKMKTLSIRQPWAWLIVRQVENLEDKKDVENRSKRTKIRGEIFIHASKTFDWDGLLWMSTHYQWTEIYDDVRKHFGTNLLNGTIENNQNQFGGIVGKANLVDCVENHPSKFFFGKYGYVLKDAVEILFMACKGMPGFFDIDYQLK